MEETQSLRLIGKVDVEEITPYNVDGQNIVYWEDIEQVFPGVKHVKNGKVTINMMRGSDGIRYEMNKGGIDTYWEQDRKEKSLKESSMLLHTL